MRPEAYGALRPTAVELAETHISWVFLLADDVFKVKKPVELGFLDFRTIERKESVRIPPPPRPPTPDVSGGCAAASSSRRRRSRR
jgi:hypothetical protein